MSGTSFFTGSLVHFSFCVYWGGCASPVSAPGFLYLPFLAKKRLCMVRGCGCYRATTSTYIYMGCILVVRLLSYITFVIVHSLFFLQLANFLSSGFPPHTLPWSSPLPCGMFEGVGVMQPPTNSNATGRIR